jgi:uncharacterized protein
MILPFIPFIAEDRTNAFLKDYSTFDLSPNEISHSLAGINRYQGYGNPRINVAFHSLVLSYLVDEENAPHALMHEIIECLTGDINGLLKKQFNLLKIVEDQMLDAVLPKFGLNGELPHQVELLDKAMCQGEIRALESGSDTVYFNHVNGAVSGFTILNDRQAEYAWMKRYTELFGF